MAKYTGPKDRLSRREGVDLFGKGTKLSRLNVPPGVHGPRGFRKGSQYSRQLREKQKTKRLYGLLERQFKNYVNLALKSRGNTGEMLLSYLERRLDNVVYRLGLAPTRNGARQLVSHGHVMVNSKKLNISSYQVKIDDTVVLSTKALSIPHIKKLAENSKYTPPKWLTRKGAAGKMVKIPKKDDIIEPISEQDIVEFYSR